MYPGEAMGEFNLDEAIRKVPDFPKPGILFYDITGVLVNPEAFGYCIDRMLERYRNVQLDGVVAIDARGFLFAAPFARERKLPIVLARKGGKLPGKKVKKSFQLEYGEDEVEMHEEDLATVRRVLLVDDLIATGGTLRAAADLVEESGGTVVEIFSVIGLPFLDYGGTLGDIPVTTLIEYHGE